MRRSGGRPGGGDMAAIALVALVGAAITAVAYWPGLMTWDSMRQYGEALSGEIDDWHPPVMQWVWRRLIMLHPGPAPMLLVQLALYWGGLALLAAVRRREGRIASSRALLACGFLPLGLALTGAILKDSLMAGVLLVATGLLALQRRRGGAWPGVVGVALLFFAAALRFNAFTACLPLLVAFLPRAWLSDTPRSALTVVIATAALMAATPVADRLIGATHSGVERSLVLFDLGGITDHSGVDVFPAAFGVDDAVRVNHRCYRPDKWDSYSDWVDPECPLGFSAWNDDVAPAGVKPYPTWVRAVVGHPVAYAAHRLTHFAINTRILPLPDSVERPVQVTGPPNRWGYRVTAGPVLTMIDTLAVATAHTPLGWPIVWIALALGALIAGWGLPGHWPAMPLALSSVLYGLGYLVFSVAVELRYHLWTELAALLACVLVASDRQAVRSRRRLVPALIPVALALVAGVVARV